MDSSALYSGGSEARAKASRTSIGRFKGVILRSDPTVGRVRGVVARQGVNKHEQIEKRIRATKNGSEKEGWLRVRGRS